MKLTVTDRFEAFRTMYNYVCNAGKEIDLETAIEVITAVGTVDTYDGVYIHCDFSTDEIDVTKYDEHWGPITRRQHPALLTLDLEGLIGGDKKFTTPDGEKITLEQLKERVHDAIPSTADFLADAADGPDARKEIYKMAQRMIPYVKEELKIAGLKTEDPVDLKMLIRMSIAMDITSKFFNEQTQKMILQMADKEKVEETMKNLMALLGK